MTMVKKIQLSMRELFGKWQNSQQTLASKSEAVLVDQLWTSVASSRQVSIAVPEYLRCSRDLGRQGAQQ